MGHQQMGSALKVARAGPAAPPVDLSRIESESNPETLRGLLRRLFADREELASRNWALDATNRYTSLLRCNSSYALWRCVMRSHWGSIPVLTHACVWIVACTGVSTPSLRRLS